MTAAIILAAGASTRFGSPKQLAIVAGERLLERAIRTAREAGCFPVLVVLGAHARWIQRECELAGTLVLLNDLWQEGMSSSLRLGISAVEEADSAVVMTCDMPGVSASHLRALVAAEQMTASRYAGRNGVPAFFPHAAFPSLLATTGDAGARHLLRDAHAIALEDGELDIDTPADMQCLAVGGSRN